MNENFDMENISNRWKISLVTKFSSFSGWKCSYVRNILKGQCVLQLYGKILVLHYPVVCSRKSS
jgi:hypothetical protein